MESGWVCKEGAKREKKYIKMMGGGRGTKAYKRRRGI